MSPCTAAHSMRRRSQSTTGSGGAMPSLAIGLLAALLALPAPHGADLTVSGVSATRNGNRVLVTDTVRNLGTKRTPRTRVEYRLVGPAGRPPRLPAPPPPPPGPPAAGPG